MSVPFLFVLVGAGILGWWLFARQLTARPWEREQQAADNQYGAHGIAVAPARVGLWVLLAVITSFFGLFISAYSMRMMVPDWHPLADPPVLWLNTLLLALSSLAFQWAAHAADRGDASRARTAMTLAGALAIAFLAGQLVAWRQLDESGEYLSGNVANAFFYLLTCLHGLHLLGGLTVWSRTSLAMWRGNSRLGEVRLSIGLCAMYWHFLLLVWLVLFGLLLAT